MGIKDVKDAFNSVSQPAGFVCGTATLTYVPVNGEEMQRIAFSGTRPNGDPFSVSADVPGEGGLLAAARGAATNLIGA